MHNRSNAILQKKVTCRHLFSFVIRKTNKLRRKTAAKKRDLRHSLLPCVLLSSVRRYRRDG